MEQFLAKVLNAGRVEEVLIVRIGVASVFLWALNAGAQLAKPVGKIDGLVGAVSKVSVELARLSGEGKELSRVKVETTSYNKEGRRTERSIHNDYGFYVGREIYTYDSKGFLSQQFFYGSNDLLIETNVYTHDSTGEPKQIRTSDEKGQVNLYRYYKRKANLIEEIYERSNRIVERRITKLDSKGHVVETASYDAQGLLQERRVYGYPGDTENPAWETLYHSDGSLGKKFVHLYELDPEGNWIKRVTSVTSGPKAHFNESTFITYRAITYY